MSRRWRDSTSEVPDRQLGTNSDTLPTRGFTAASLFLEILRHHIFQQLVRVPALLGGRVG